MITPDPKPATANNETCVPEQAFSANGETPEVGSDIEFTGKARVTRVEGGHVYFETTEVNGQAVSAPEGGGDMTEDELMQKAMQADAEGGV